MAEKQKLSYTAALEAVKHKSRHQAAKEIGDQWRTPDWLFWAVNSMVGGRLKLDLFTDGQNSKCQNYFTAEDNALQQDWTAALMDIEMEEGDKPMAYANPPYSIAQDENGDPLTGMRRIMAKAAEERDRGAASIWVVKSATSETWWPAKAFDEEEGVQADAIIFIKGRIAFEPPVWYRPDEGVTPPTSAGFGAAILVFDKNIDPKLKAQDGKYVSRTMLQTFGEPLASSAAAQRAEWIASFDKCSDCDDTGYVGGPNGERGNHCMLCSIEADAGDPPFYWVHHESGCTGIADTHEALDEALAEGAMQVDAGQYSKWEAEYDEL